MSGNHVELELIGYHFGLVSNDAREKIETHLVACGECLQAFLGVKRSVETSEDAPEPSAIARARLRKAVFSELHPKPKWSWWERPVAFAAAASAVLVAGAMTHALTSAPGSPPYAASDHSADHK
jgi:hypothetical protein